MWKNFFDTKHGICVQIENFCVRVKDSKFPKLISTLKDSKFHKFPRIFKNRRIAIIIQKILFIT